jgi:hypothetical protein
MAEGPTSIQQEADNIYQLLDPGQARNKEIKEGEEYGSTDTCTEVSYVRNGMEQEFVSQNLLRIWRC